MTDPKNAFEQATTEPELPIMQEFLLFLRENKKWWLLPIVLVMGLCAFLAMASSTAMAPFIYTLF